jgi:multicomponent Na+:H+ antiporter subunit G
MEIIKLIGAIFLLGGALSLLVSAIGLLRMPDIYNRVQVGTKASTFGAIISFIGLALLKYEMWFTSENWLGRAIILVIFILLTNPVSSHVLMRAAYFMKCPLSKITKIDMLKDDIENKIVKDPNDE